MDEGKIDILDARTLRLDEGYKDHDKRLRDLERSQYADYQWRKSTDLSLASINTKLETLLSADGKTYSTIKISIITGIISAMLGYAVRGLLG